MARKLILSSNDWRFINIDVDKGLFRVVYFFVNYKRFTIYAQTGGDRLGSVVKKRRKKMRKHKHKKLLARTRHQRRKGK